MAEENELPSRVRPQVRASPPRLKSALFAEHANGPGIVQASSSLCAEVKEVVKEMARVLEP